MIYRNCICIKLYLFGGEEEEKGCNYIFYSVKLQNQNSLSNLTSILHSGFMFVGRVQSNEFNHDRSGDFLSEVGHEP